MRASRLSRRTVGRTSGARGGRAAPRSAPPVDAHASASAAPAELAELSDESALARAERLGHRWTGLPIGGDPPAGGAAGRLQRMPADQIVTGRIYTLRGRAEPFQVRTRYLKETRFVFESRDRKTRVEVTDPEDVLARFESWEAAALSLEEEDDDDDDRELLEVAEEVSSDVWIDAEELFPGYDAKIDGGKIVRLRNRFLAATFDSYTGMAWSSAEFRERFNLNPKGHLGLGTMKMGPAWPALGIPPPGNAGEEAENEVGYLVTVPVPATAEGALGKDKSSPQLFAEYVDAFPKDEVDLRLRGIFGVNLLDDVWNLDAETEEVQEELLDVINEQQGKLNELPARAALFGYLLRFPLYDTWGEEEVSTDYVRSVGRMTPGLERGSRPTFPFAGVRSGTLDNDVARGYLGYLYSHNRNVFVHTGDADLISLRPRGAEQPSVFEELSAYIKDPGRQTESGASKLGRVGGAYSFSGEEIRALLKAQGVLQKAKLDLLTELTQIFNQSDMAFRGIMGGGRVSAAWFAEPNTLINAALLANADVRESLQQEAARKVGMPDYFLPLQATLAKLAAGGSSLPTESALLADPKYRLLTSARHDLATAPADEDSPQKVLDKARRAHNVQYRASQIEAVWNASYVGVGKSKVRLIWSHFHDRKQQIEVATWAVKNGLLAEEIEERVEKVKQLNEGVLKAIAEVLED